MREFNLKQAVEMLVRAYVTAFKCCPACIEPGLESNLALNRSDVRGSNRVPNATQGNSEDQH